MESLTSIDSYMWEYYKPISSLPFLPPELLHSGNLSEEMNDKSNNYSDVGSSASHTNRVPLFSYDEQQMTNINNVSDLNGGTMPSVLRNAGEKDSSNIVTSCVSPSMAYYRYRLLNCLLHVSREGEYLVSGDIDLHINNPDNNVKCKIEQQQDIRRCGFRRNRPAVGRGSHLAPSLPNVGERTTIDILDDIWTKHLLLSKGIHRDDHTVPPGSAPNHTIFSDYSVERHDGRIDNAEFMEALCTSLDLFMKRRADIGPRRDVVSRSTTTTDLVSPGDDIKSSTIITNSTQHTSGDQAAATQHNVSSSNINLDPTTESSPATASQRILANPVENVMTLSAPHGAVVFGPVRGHACDFATNLLRHWLHFPDMKGGESSCDVKPIRTTVGKERLNVENKETGIDTLGNDVKAVGTHGTKVTSTSITEKKIRSFFKRFINGVYFDDCDNNSSTTQLFKVKDLVILGSIIDGGHESVEILTIVCWLSLVLMAHPQYYINPNDSDTIPGASPSTSVPMYPCRDRLAIVKGPHELLFPITMMCTGAYIGRLDHELSVRYSNDSYPEQSPQMENNSCEPRCYRVQPSSHLHATMERMIYALFEEWPVAAIVQGKYFCVSGGIPSSMKTISDINTSMNRMVNCDEDGDDFVKLCELVFSDPMDDDDERRLPPLTMFANNCERGLSHNYSFNAVCRFLKCNNLLCMIRANSYTSHRLSGASSATGRPWHYKYSSRDIGYRLYRLNPNTGMPSIISLFSVSQFASQNHNYGAIAIIPPCILPEPQCDDDQKSNKQLAQFIKIQQLNVAPNRPLQLPGTTSNAFAWSFPLIVHALRSAVGTMIYSACTDETSSKKGLSSSSCRTTRPSSCSGSIVIDDTNQHDNIGYMSRTPCKSVSSDEQQRRKMVLSTIDKESHGFSITHPSYLFRAIHTHNRKSLNDIALKGKSKYSYVPLSSPVLSSASQIDSANCEEIEEVVEANVAKFYRLMMVLQKEGLLGYFRNNMLEFNDGRAMVGSS